MTNPEQFLSREVIIDRNVLFYETIDSLNEEKHANYTAIEQIKGKELMKLYLLGSAQKISDNPKDYPRNYIFDGSQAYLVYAINDIYDAARYYINRDDDFQTIGDQYREIINPWTEAYKSIIEEQ